MLPPLYNLHNHTPYSDGAYSIDELCEAHLAQRDFKVAGIGITDHLFCTPSSHEVASEREFRRLFAGEVRGYVEDVHAARRRWDGKLRVLCGCEVNWPLNKGYLDAVRELLIGIDYVLFEFVDWAGLTQLANQSRRFPCPLGLAHTDVRRQFPNTSMDQVVRTMSNARIFYELNSKFLPLSDGDRWMRLLPNHRVAITLGTDTHDDLHSVQDLPTLYQYAERHGLGQRLLDVKYQDRQARAQPA